MDLADLRERRLRALGASSNSSSGSSSSDVGQQKQEQAKAAAPASSSSASAADVCRKTPLDAATVASLFNSMFDQTRSTPEDKQRWLTQGFVLCSEPSFGLEQGKGGPCAVLAAVQAEMLRFLLFGGRKRTAEKEAAEDGKAGPAVREVPQMTTEQAEDCLVKAVLSILALVVGDEADGARIAVVTTVGGGGEVGTSSEQLKYQRMDLPVPEGLWSGDEGSASLTASTTFRYVKDEALGQLRGSHGIFLFVMSLLLSRGLDRVKQDRDDSDDGCLTGQFGHSSQELLNLLLCGRAVSNVFDGVQTLGESGMTLNGVPHRPNVGFLTHLEALRYCQVGTFYKCPLDPIWVVGSSSHYTVLFSADRAAVRETASELLLQRVTRAFKAADTQEAGFIETGKLRAVLADLLPELAGDAHDGRVGALASKLEMPGGTGIIVWSDFWQAVSSLMSGAASLTQLLGGDQAAAPQPGSPGGGSPRGQQRPRSDSDVARELQAQFDDVPPPLIDADLSASGSGAAGVAAGDTTGGGDRDASSFPSQLVRSDSDIARQMQAEFDADEQGWGGGDASVMAVGSPVPQAAAGGGGSQLGPGPASVPGGGQQQQGGAAAWGGGGGGSGGGSSTSTSHNPRAAVHRHDSVAGEDDPSFELFHYNGLTAGGKKTPALVRFRLTRRSADSAVGASVSLDGGGAGAGAAYACPIEAVLHTKWPGARVDWRGTTPPSID